VGGGCACARALKIGRGLCRLRLIDAGIDLVERLALADDRSLAEQAAQDDAGNLRPDFGHLKRSDPPRQFLLDRRAALLDDDIADLDRPLGSAAPSARSRVRAAAAGSEQARSK